MITEDQSKVIAFFEGAHSHAGEIEERFTTHISHVFLTKALAYKLKRALKLPYVDFSTPQKRLHFCHREVELNRRTAPELYLGVRKITRAENESLEFDGTGELVDAAVEMIRFKTDDLFAFMAKQGRLDSGHLQNVADTIANFHATLEPQSDSGSSLMDAVLSINEGGLNSTDIFDHAAVVSICHEFREAFHGLKEHLYQRSRTGKVVLGHGDLHLRNICLFREQPTLFDCIDFNDAIATIDKMYDVAFLIMDLWYRELPHFSNLTANRYCDMTGDEDGYPLLGFFMAVRAAVRAHTTATQISESDREDPKLVTRAHRYFDLARQLLKPGSPKLVVIGGLSGSGKTSVAQRLAACVDGPPGARVLESDRIRKRLFDVAPETRLPEAAYKPDVSDSVYDLIASRAEAALRLGAAVVADAVYSDTRRRSMISKSAHGEGVPFTGIWLSAPVETLRHRIASREESASDADLSILDRQLQAYEKPDDWVDLDSSRPIPEIVDRIMREIS